MYSVKDMIVGVVFETTTKEKAMEWAYQTLDNHNWSMKGYKKMATILDCGNHILIERAC